jgi:hypothetical protein
MGKKFCSFLLIFSLFFTPIGISEVSASTAESTQVKKQVSSAFNKVLSKGKEGKYHIDGMTVNVDYDYVVVDKKSKKVTIQEKKKTAKGIKFEGVTLAHGIAFIPPKRENNGYPGKGYVYTFFRVVDTDGPIGPLNIKGEVDVNTSDYQNGPFKDDFANVQVDWNWFEYSEGSTEFSTTEVKSTKFYEVSTDVEVKFMTNKDRKRETWGPLLANKKAFEYPCRYYDPVKTWVPLQCHGGDHTYQILYKDPNSDKTMYTPTTTLMKQVPADQRVPWNNELRGEYIAKYIQTYGDPKKKDPKFNWSDYDIHHIIPREYGGTNDFNNLIPLKREFHQQNVTPWWTNY